MRIVKLAIAGGMVGVLLIGGAMDGVAQTPIQPTTVRQIAFDYDDYFYFVPEEPPTESPSDVSEPTQADAVEADCDIGCDGCCDPCRSCCCDITIGGWLDQGFTYNPADPTDRWNGPVTFNDRANEYQMNQLYVYAEHKAETNGCGWDIGGRVDLLYGTDSRFTLARGLDDDWDSSRFYGLSMPQLYLDVAYNDLTVRMGHFYTILGYETAMAVDNFFYSHAYTMQYGEPFTHTGLLAIYDVDPNWTVSAGFTRGWNTWEDINGDLDFLGGVSWTSCDECTSLAFAIETGSEDAAGAFNRTVYSLVFWHYLTERWQWVLQHDLGYEDNAALGGADAEWYGVNTYLFYDINCEWRAGVRYEWFADDDGVRVNAANGAGGAPRGIPLNGVPAHWQEIAIGLRWQPRSNIIWRTECRWDWVDPLVAVVNGPFNDFQDLSQFLWSTDLILTY